MARQHRHPRRQPHPRSRAAVHHRRQGVASFGLAVNRRYQQSTANGRSRCRSSTSSCWGQLGENAAASLTKGTRVIVTGRLEQRSWETQDGEKRNVVEVVADELGPSLRWAPAQVERTERTGADGGVSGGGGGGGGRRRRRCQRGGGRRQPDPVYGDEEPF